MRQAEKLGRECVAKKYKGCQSTTTETGTIAYSIQTLDGTYTGELGNGTPHGQGTWTAPDIGKYVGQWKDGVMHGQGAWIHLDGGKYVGEWKDGKYWEGTGYEKDGNVAFTYSEGVSKFAN